ncbi:MAG: phage tail protein [Phycisphaerae bacterium]|nr:phage tail protein [Saprospiraceae bacterium]
MEGTIGTIMMFAGNFAPKNWAYCAGQLLNIASNTALFSILGTTYGGDGRVTFGLPDLQGRVAVGAGQGPGLSDYGLGQVGGAENTTMNVAEMATHTHTAGAVTIPLSNSAATLMDASNNILGTPTSDTYATPGTSPAVNYGSFSAAVGLQGGSQPFSILQPYECVAFVICQYGFFPARN